MLIGTPSIDQRQIGAVVGVEAAQEVLVRLAAARVLHDHQPGRDAQDVLHVPDGRAAGSSRSWTVNDDAALIGFVPSTSVDWSGPVCTPPRAAARARQAARQRAAAAPPAVAAAGGTRT